MRRSTVLLAASSLLLAACGGSPKSAEAPPNADGLASAGGAAYAPPQPTPQAYPGAPPADEAVRGPAPVAVAGTPVLPTAAATGVAPSAVATASPSEAFRPAPSGVRAGEWDDNANYRDFLGYIKNSSQLGIEAIDVSTRRFVIVKDKDGNGVPNCRITVSDSTQKSASLTTAASGRAVLFPGMMGLGTQLTAKTSCQGQSVVTKSFDTSAGGDGLVELNLNVARADVSKPTVDVVFILDTTGSMSEEIEGVKTTLKTVLANLDQNVKIRVGLVEYKDREDSFVTKTYALTNDVKSLSASIAGISAQGGGDTPEDVQSGLSVAINQMLWNDKAVARLAFLIADAPPHLDYQDGTPYSTSSKKAIEKGIKVFTVAASGMDNFGQAVFRQIAQVTGGTNMFVLRGGAGSQSTGGGDPTSSCGATHQNYSSGKLDQLIVGKINLELTSLKADPTRIPGLNKDENAKACADRVLIVAK
ncbi:MAG: VWA domain-containing protein [Polyangiaceae bacterium]|nr:VWA domain-containing protein [Polyangiaceae bacterium]